MRFGICFACVVKGYTHVDWKGYACSGKCKQTLGHRWFEPEDVNKTTRECRACARTFATCRRCKVFLSLETLAGGKNKTYKNFRQRYETKWHICSNCESQEYDANDVATHTCRNYAICKARAGAKAFESQSINNKKKGQADPICKACFPKSKKRK